MSKVSGGLPTDGDLLLGHARKNALDQGFTLEPDFEAAFLAKVSQRWDEPGHSMEEALTNTTRFISEATRIAKDRSKNSLDGVTFNLVLTTRGLCPLWPFC